MRKILSTILLVITAHMAFCQQDSVLKTFKYRINNYRAVGFNVGGGSQYQRSDVAIGTTKNSSSSGGFGITYYTLKSTDRILSTTTSGLYSSFFSGKEDYPNNLNKTKSFSVLPSFSLLNKWFSKNKFIELGTDLVANFNGNKSVSSSAAGTSKNTEAQYNLSVTAGIGKGRLENITDMQNALWLYKELSSIKSLSRTLTADELNKLGRAITKGNNTRVLDSRRKTQFILATADDYLQQKKLITKTDINYFTHLNDILFFAINIPRLSGIEKFIRLTPAISNWNNDEEDNNLTNQYKHRFSTQSVVLSSGISKYVPVNLFHQNNYGASVKLSAIFMDGKDRYFTNDNLTNEIKSSSTLKQAGINLFFQHAIYPNTRTLVDINLQSEAGYYELEPNSGFYGKANLYAALSYFISYRTRLGINLGTTWQKNMYNTGRYLELEPLNFLLYANATMQINL